LRQVPSLSPLVFAIGALPLAAAAVLSAASHTVPCYSRVHVPASAPPAPPPCSLPFCPPTDSGYDGSMTTVDLLAFGPHPDDLEIGMAGTLAHHAVRGVRVGLCDLTRGERGSNGTPEERAAEAEAAAVVLGAAWRVNLGLPDGGLALVPEQVHAVAALIRGARPSVVAIPSERDRHPDHVAAHALLVRAVFDAGLRRFDAPGSPWRPARVISYFINDSVTPSFVVDVTGTYPAKRRALACYRTQFAPVGEGAAATRLTSPLFMQLVESRDRQFGASAGVEFAEGFVARDPLLLADLFATAALPFPAAEPAR
jgi:bacillithiol biosynthesis deacetylase BshB1